MAEDESHRKFNIEFQVCDHKYFIERGIYYWARAYSRQLQGGVKYVHLRPVVSIFLTDFHNPAKLGGLYERQADRIHQSFSIRSDELPEVVLTDHLSLHFLQLPKMIDASSLAEVCPQLADWLTYFGYPHKTTEADMESTTASNMCIASAFGDYRTFHLDQDLRLLAENAEFSQQDTLAYGESCEARGKADGKVEGLAEGEAKGKAEGKAEGLAEGEAKGKAEGKAEGLVEGVAKGKAEIVVNMLREGLSIDFVANLTGFSEEEIKDISKK
ncbi:MAG: Rpn family recombination-promoting nuclease/putative transposase [Thermoguttaceae bacterium]|nr:Rpn family recombination-promoting nuclease/putative transposase [Thermoguttaceae bacterium]